MNGRAPAILDHLAALADTTRSRVLLLLDRHELTVSELCGIVQLPQSTVSRHLKALADSGWIAARSEGTSRLYTMTRDELDASARRLWLLVREQVGPTAAAGQDQRRLRAALAQRRTKSQEFFSSSAGHWAGARARGGRPHAQARRSRDYRRHAPARSRELPSTDGSRLARLFRRSHTAYAERCRLRGCQSRRACAGRSREGPRAVCGNWKETNATTKTRRHETALGCRQALRPSRARMREPGERAVGRGVPRKTID